MARPVVPPPASSRPWEEYDEARLKASQITAIAKRGALSLPFDYDTAVERAIRRVDAARARLTSLLSGARALTAPNDAAEEHTNG